MVTNQSRFSLLRKLDPHSAAGRAALLQLTQKDINDIRDQFPQLPSYLSNLTASLCEFISKLTLFTLLLIIGFGLIVDVASRFNPGPFGPMSPSMAEEVLTTQSILMLSGFLSTWLISRWFVVRDNLHVHFSPLTEYPEDSENALQAVQNFAEAGAYHRAVILHRELVPADVVAILAIAEQCEKALQESSLLQSHEEHGKRIKQASQDLQKP